MCDFKNCKVTPALRVIMEDDEEYDLCFECYDYEIMDPEWEFKRKIFRDYAKQVIPMVVQ